MKKFLFLGAFALFALTASAQSTQAPAEKKAKTEQTCSKDANKATCSKDKAAAAAARALPPAPTPRAPRAARTRLQAAAARALPPAPTPRAPRAARTRPQDAAQPRPLQKSPRRKRSPARRATRLQVSPEASESACRQLDDTEKGKAQPAFPFFMPRGREAWPVWGSLAIFAPLGNGSGLVP